MADQEHLNRLKEGVEAWNTWRSALGSNYPHLQGADLQGANLRGANLNGARLQGANLSYADLYYANLNGAFLWEANLQGANLWETGLISANLHRADLNGAHLRVSYLREADLSGANLSEAHLEGSDLREADLSGANLIEAHLRSATLTGANLERAILVSTDFTNAILSNCRIYGTAVWNAKLQGAKQNDLIITPHNEAVITVDTLEVAQFVYLLLNNEKIRDVINTLTTKAVLILGRFTSDRKAVLDAIREELRKHNYVPILFDFEKPQSRDITETVTTLARLSRFIVADLTDPHSIPQELESIVPHLPSVPVQPLLLSSQREYGMYEHFTRYPWVLPVYRYADEGSLLQSLQEKVITPAEQKAKELEGR